MEKTTIIHCLNVVMKGSWINFIFVTLFCALFTTLGAEFIDGIAPLTGFIAGALIAIIGVASDKLPEAKKLHAKLKRSYTI